MKTNLSNIIKIETLSDDQVKEMLQSGKRYTDGKGDNIEFIKDQDVSMLQRKGKKDPVRTGRIMIWEDYIKYLRKQNYYFI